jgi:hypothetical protein
MLNITTQNKTPASNTDTEVIAWDELTTRKALAPKKAKTISATIEDGRQTYNVEIVAGESIRLFGIYRGGAEPKAFDITFRVGDAAEYDSYNLKYVGTITSIGAKTITIKKETSRRSARLNLRAFAWRNWDFDAELIFQQNSDTMNYI